MQVAWLLCISRGLDIDSDEKLLLFGECFTRVSVFDMTLVDQLV